MTGVSRRTLIASGAAVAGAIAAGQVLPDAASAAGLETAASPSTPEHTPLGHRHGNIKDVKHVVILMQENRSFDHYYGALAGVRGFADKQALTYPDGTTVFEQPDPKRANKTLLPFRMDTTQYDAQEAGDLDHSWGGTHAAWNGGAWNRWVTAKGEETMGLLHPRRHPVAVRARRRLHDLRRLLLLDPGPDHAEPAVPLDRHQRPGRHRRRPRDQQPRRLPARLQLDHLPGAAAAGGRQLAGLREHRDR